MRRPALAVVVVAGAVIAGCGGPPSSAPGPPQDVMLSAVSGTPAVIAEPSATTTSAPVVATTVAPASTPTPPPATFQEATAETTSAPYSPGPPAPGVQPDGYAGYGGITTAMGDGTSATLQVYPREQYLGERVQVRTNVSGTTAIRSIRIDLGDGTVQDEPLVQSWGCPTEWREVGGGTPAHIYAAPGTYRIRLTVTAVPCEILPGPPGGWTLPDGRPAVGMPLPWNPTGPDQVLTAVIDLIQRPDPPPPPVGPPPGP